MPAMMAIWFIVLSRYDALCAISPLCWPTLRGELPSEDTSLKVEQKL